MSRNRLALLRAHRTIEKKTCKLTLRTKINVSSSRSLPFTWTYCDCTGVLEATVELDWLTPSTEARGVTVKWCGAAWMSTSRCLRCTKETEAWSPNGTGDGRGMHAARAMQFESARKRSATRPARDIIGSDDGPAVKVGNVLSLWRFLYTFE